MYGPSTYSSFSSSNNMGHHDLVTSLFIRANLPRSHRPSAQISKVCPDKYLGPVAFVSKIKEASDEDKKQSSKLFELKTGLFEMASVQPSGEPPRLWVFPTQELESELKLQAPRKVQAFVPAPAPPPQQSQKSKENIKKMRAANTIAGRAKRSLLVMDNSHYVENDITTVGKTAIHVDDMDDAMARKRSRLGDSDDGGVSIMRMYEEALPVNFYELINELFQHFWAMEFDEAIVSQAFFAKIDAANCTEYGLQSFADSASCLVVIRDRVDATLVARHQGANAQPGYGATPYRSLEDFFTDFREMFDNAYKYYPADSPVQAKAKELDAVFKQKWEECKKNFKY